MERCLIFETGFFYFLNGWDEIICLITRLEIFCTVVRKNKSMQPNCLHTVCNCVLFCYPVFLCSYWTKKNHFLFFLSLWIALPSNQLFMLQNWVGGNEKYQKQDPLLNQLISSQQLKREYFSKDSNTNFLLKFRYPCCQDILMSSRMYSQ